MIKIKERKLSNNLPVALIQNKSLKSAVATLLIRSGSVYENKKNNGISHLLEHLVFFQKNTSKLKKFFPLNLEISAWTRKDFTCFEIVQHKDYLEKIIKILFILINDIEFTNQDLSMQKRIITQEINEKNEEPFEILEEEIEKVLYKNQNLGLGISGGKSSLKSLNLENLKNWYKKFYTPANMVLSVSGNFDFNRVYKVIEKEFSQLISQSNSKISLPALKYNRSQNITKNKNFDQAYLGISFPVKEELGGKNYFKCSLLAEILNKKLGLIQEKEEFNFYDLSVDFNQNLRAGDIRILTSAPKNSAGRELNKLKKKIWEINFSREFFEKIKTITKKQFLLKEDNVDELSSLSLYKLAGGKKILTPLEESKEIGKINYEDLLKLKDNLINQENCFVVKFR